MSLQIEGALHLVFAMEKTLQLLGNAKTWYMDDMFKIAKKPFMQICG